MIEWNKIKSWLKGRSLKLKRRIRKERGGRNVRKENNRTRDNNREVGSLCRCADKKVCNEIFVQRKRNQYHFFIYMANLSFQ